MKKAFLCSVVLLLAGTFAHSQTNSAVFDGSVELMSHVVVSPKPVNGKVYIAQGTYNSSRFDLINLKNGCVATQCIVYGDRYGNNWDILHIGGGAVNRTRMVQIGKYKWTDTFNVPYVEPWAALAPGETRTVTVNTSGGDGADGSPGANGGSSGIAQMNGGALSMLESVKNPDYGSASLGRQVSSSVKTADGKTRKDPYSPVVEAKLGYMYVVRAVDEQRDNYVLVRVDELKRGERLVLSYKKLVLP